MAEIDDAQLATLQRGMELLTQLSQNPATRREFERSVKKLRPEIETADDLAESYAAPVREEIKTVTSKIDAFLDAQAKREADAATAAADRTAEEAFGRLQKAGYTTEGLETIKGLMVQRNIADPEAAAALFDKLNPPQQLDGGGAWEPASYDIKSNAVDRDVEGLFADPEKWGDREVYNVLREMRSGGEN